MAETHFESLINVIKDQKKDSVEAYNQIESALKKKGELFTDEAFPPAMSSLTSNISEFPLAQDIVWKRISEVYKDKKLTLCSDEVGSNDILSNGLVSAHFVGMLAEKKDLIKRLFHSKEISPVGCYSVWLCDNGEWKNIVIDDYVPCTNETGELLPCFSTSKGNDIWVLLLEKALAKLFGSYHNIAFGYPSKFFNALTGAPTKQLKIKENEVDKLDQIWQFITNKLKNRFIVTAISRKDSQIIRNYILPVVDAKEVKLADGRNERLLKIKNPEASQEWKGEWDNNSSNWTPEIREKLNYDGKEGKEVFWMNLLEYDANFDSLSSCQVHDNNYYTFLRLGENKKQSHFVSKMTTSADGFVYLSSQQQRIDKRINKNIDYDYSFTRVIIAKLDQTGKIASIVHGKFKHGQSVIIRRNLSKGDYLVFVEVDWSQNQNNEINLTTYSEAKIYVQEEPLSNYTVSALYETIMKALIHSHIAQGESIKVKQYENQGAQYEIKRYSIEKYGVVGFLFENKEKDVLLSDRLSLQNLENMEIVAPINSTNVIEFQVPAGEDRVVVFKAKLTDIKNTAYSYEYSELYKLTQDYTKDQLKELCKEKGQKVYSTNNGNIEVYAVKYLGGFADYYVNKGTTGTLKEEITFDVENMLINGQEITTLEVTVAPGEDFLVDMKIKESFLGSKCGRKTRSTFIP